MCTCSALPEIIYYDKRPHGFETSLVEQAVGNWVKLFRCADCGQLWRITEWDKYQEQFAVKVPTYEGWEYFDAEPLEKALLIKTRGGLSENRCIWAGCQNLAIKEAFYCAEHLYKTGTRR